MNDENNCQAANQVLRLMYPEKLWEKVNLVQVEHQKDVNYCGLFVIAYAQFLASSKEPAYYKFDQFLMREKFNYSKRSL